MPPRHLVDTAQRTTTNTKTFQLLVPGRLHHQVASKTNEQPMFCYFIGLGRDDLDSLKTVLNCFCANLIQLKRSRELEELHAYS
eukprot:m.125332 g.125332  ORF g.125332 m.125332 type:complete len:84 (+) comp29127_c0_seq2:279-530(+)